MTTTLQTITTSSQAANLLKTLNESPLRFEKAETIAPTGLNGKYKPLNRPFTLLNGSTNGLRNGHGTSLSGGKFEEESIEDEEMLNSVNGDKKDHPISTEWNNILPRPPGLKNFGNTCYMNSTLQALMHVPPLVGYLLRRNHLSNCTTHYYYFSNIPLGDKSPRGCIFCRIERTALDLYSQPRSTFLEPLNIIGKPGCNFLSPVLINI